MLATVLDLQNSHIIKTHNDNIDAANSTKVCENLTAHVIADADGKDVPNLMFK